MLRAAVEWLIGHASPQGRQAFFDVQDFPWVAQVEAGYAAVPRQRHPRRHGLGGVTQAGAG